MARRPRKLHAQAPAKLKPTLRKHMRALGRTSLIDYFRWCRDNGFGEHVDKSRDDLEQELQAFERAESRRAAQARIHHNPAKLIEDACAGRYT